MNDADLQFVARLHDEIARALGPNVSVGDLDVLESEGAVRLTVRCVTPQGERDFVASGDTLLDASRELIERIPEERLAIAFRDLVATEGWNAGR